MKLVRASNFLGERANRIYSKLWIRRSEIDEVISVPKYRQQFAPVDMIEESADFFPPERPGKPLHVVLYEDLQRGALDRTRALNRHAHTAADGHVRAEQNSFCHFKRSREISLRNP